MKRRICKLMMPAMFIGFQLFLVGLSVLKAIATIPAIKAAGNLTSYLGCTILLVAVFGSVFGYIDYLIIQGWFDDERKKDNK